MGLAGTENDQTLIFLEAGTYAVCYCCLAGHEAEAKRPRLVPNQLGHLRRDCGPHLGRVGPVARVQLVARELKAEDQGD